ncbi:uncharacterized protein NECHADRAFT_88436 [Fusarium vanettenii 77-13-4]|uniref:Uncharacterized protein n=1 Tax=Fusarium vanettenii (strain ATCC MYA-4622 / CBS 123669 / FGSC 9596 / NRRL 45880 / 77-13-4) TaxID=660122 RepID=C7ZMF2_FUSV7|nr:uncharacterized protein NECHADRAFT_88436 [Fusarium vanettenii 77-13-4]EEU34819.1 hypothetical protein NECHADRAFT_88436 [Fusarium vanettenii 77-13-4]
MPWVKDRGTQGEKKYACTESHAASDRSPQINATASPEAISDATQQPQVHPADGHGEDSPGSLLPQDSGTAKQAKQVGNAAAQDSSTHQHREAEPENQVPANTHSDNSTTDIEASRDPSSDGSDEDIPMREAEDSPTTTPLAGSTRQAAAADSRPDPLIKQEPEPEGYDPDALMTGVEQPTCGRQDLPEATAITPPQAHESEGGPKPVVANDQPAESPGPEDSTSRLASISTPVGDTATPLPITNPASRGASSHREDSASAQISTPSLSSITTLQDRTAQPPATLNPSSQDGDAHLNIQDRSHDTTPQGSDMTEDTSRATTPDTHLTSPGTSVPDSPPQSTLSEADMGERLVETLGRSIKRDDSMHKISVPNLPIDLDLIKAQ